MGTGPLADLRVLDLSPLLPGGFCSLLLADLGAGALVAAFGSMAARHERRSSGEGQFEDVSMSDGALSWRAQVAGRYFAEERTPHRGDLELAGSLVCYRPYACSDGWVTLS